MCQFDSQGEGELDFRDFLRMAATKKFDTVSKSSLKYGQKFFSEKWSKIWPINFRSIFLKYDKRLKGSFGVNELLEVARELCENVDEEVLMEIVGRIDSNGDGKVTFEDFYNVMTKEVYS